MNIKFKINLKDDNKIKVLSLKECIFSKNKKKYSYYEGNNYDIDFEDDRTSKIITREISKELINSKENNYIRTTKNELIKLNNYFTENEYELMDNLILGVSELRNFIKKSYPEDILYKKVKKIYKKNTYIINYELKRVFKFSCINENFSLDIDSYHYEITDSNYKDIYYNEETKGMIYSTYNSGKIIVYYNIDNKNLSLNFIKRFAIFVINNLGSRVFVNHFKAFNNDKILFKERTNNNLCLVSMKNH